MRTQRERTEQTRAELVQKATALFAERGYAHVSTEQLVRACGLTRGALYHHYDGKRALFEAVVEAVQGEVTRTIERDARRQKNPWDGIKAGCAAFIRACSRPDFRQILLIDGPSVLGIERWRGIDERTSFASLKAGLEECIKAGVLQEQPVAPLARLISGALNEAAFWLAENPKSRSQRKQVLLTLNRMLDAYAAT